MQENLTIARPYAQAAFETAREAGTVAQWDDALQLLGTIVGDAAMRRVIVDPGISRQRLLDLLFDLGGQHFAGAIGNFVKVLVAAHRLDIAPEIAQVYAEHRATQDNVANVEVVSAFPLEPAQAERIGNAMRKRLGKEIRITHTIDQALIGGARVKVGDMVYDASLRGGLNQLTNVFNLK
ncbi:MAG: F0F1 ATP synthase subunit delta [Rhodococcus sp.]|nr:F0F1 ATP synthase subunit delta [Rhodococcus sp. (in: high G+C Gram-positive bacteria)]